ncbi:MAG: hypothetical protein U0263_17890 [Polyangiaceae bacterium]
MTLVRLGGAVVLGGLVLAALSSESAARAPSRLESPDEAECFEWKYPKDKACGSLSGKTECKAKPTIEGSDDDDAKSKCKPKKGDTCTCE